jgi:glycosyltransferase involved in cell wall biosynthesis
MAQFTNSHVGVHSIRAGQYSSPALALSPKPAVKLRRLQNLIICHVLSINRASDPRAFYCQARPFAARGLHVRVLSPNEARGLRDGVELIPLRWWSNRLIRMLMSQMLIIKALGQRADLYHLHDPELIPAGWVLKILFRKKVVYDAREDYPAMMLNKAYLPKPFRTLAARAMTCLESFAARTLDGLITADPFTLLRLGRVGPSKKLVFYNFPNYEIFPSPSSNESKPFDMVYRGGLSERCGTFLLIDAFQNLIAQGKDLRLLLIGYFDNQQTKELVEKRIRTLGLGERVEVVGYIPYDQMARALSRARIGVCPLQAIPKFQRNIPVKVFEYWACGLPVVASDLPPIRPFLRSQELGLLVKPGDAREMSQAIGWLLDHPNEATHIGIRGRQAVVERYNNCQEARKLLSFYKRILEK